MVSIDGESLDLNRFREVVLEQGGIWLDNQIRYDMMLATERETLVDDFKRAGHHTVVVMPAIIHPWPEGERFGYDEILVRKDIDYAGPALNWVEMPDQFTWSFVQQRVREQPRSASSDGAAHEARRTARAATASTVVRTALEDGARVVAEQQNRGRLQASVAHSSLAGQQA